MIVGNKIPPREPHIAKGTYPAVCVGIVDIGTQPCKFKDAKSTEYKRQLLIVFEFPSERTEADGVDKPKWLSKDVTWAQGKTSNLYKIATELTDWDDDDLEGFDTDYLLGAPAMVKVEVKDSGYSNISSITELMKGVPAPKPENPFLTFDMDHWDDDVFASLPEGFQKKIMRSLEYQKNHLPQDEVSVEAAEAAASKAAEEEGSAGNGGVPF